MTRTRFVPVLVALALSAPLYAQQQFTVLATILDPETGTPAETLTPGDVRVTEDGLTAKVVKVDPVVRAVKVQLLIDNGLGVGRNLGEMKTGVRRLVEALPPNVETTIVTTSPQPRFLVRATKNRDEVLKGVERLAPDTGTGRFTEGIAEAAERANRDKDAFTLIIAAGTTSGDAHITEIDVKRAVDLIRGRPLLIHVLLYSGERSASGGEMQIEVGQLAAKMTGGRYEFINNMNRYTTLMPELGAEVAKQLTGNTRQFRITAQRPDGKKGDFGKLSMSAGAKVVSSVRVE